MDQALDKRARAIRRWEFELNLIFVSQVRVDGVWPRGASVHAGCEVETSWDLLEGHGKGKGKGGDESATR